MDRGVGSVDMLVGVPDESALHDDFRRVAPALEGELVRLRAREQEDLERLNEMFDHPDVLAGLVIAFPQPMADIRAWVEGTRTLDDQIHFVIETLAGESMGICGLQNIDARARKGILGIWIGKP